MKKSYNTGTSLVPDEAEAVRHFFGPLPDLNNQCQKADAVVSSPMPMPSYANMTMHGFLDIVLFFCALRYGKYVNDIPSICIRQKNCLHPTLALT
jgi:hypothetical protein